MFTVRWRDHEDQTNIFCRVRRIGDNKLWSLGAWATTTESADNAYALTETPSGSGLYLIDDLAFDAAPGSSYKLSICRGETDPIIESTYIYPGEKKTALQHVNDIQAALRMPLSTDFTGAHAKLVLAQINTAITLMSESTVWPETKCQGLFTTVAGKNLYSIRPANTPGIERFSTLQIGTGSPLKIVNDRDFFTQKITATTENQPTHARYFGRMGDMLVLELWPTPDDVYEISFDGSLRIPRLVSTTDIAILDDDMIALGGLALSKKEQGEAFQSDWEFFLSKVRGQVASDSEISWEDAETV